MFITEYNQEKYNQTFESVYAHLKELKEENTCYTLHDLKNLLESLYINEGNDWIGRGEAKDITHTATIAACETLLSEWKSEENA